MNKQKILFLSFFIIIPLLFGHKYAFAGEISDNTYLIAKVNAENLNNSEMWKLIGNSKFTGIELDASVNGKNILISNSAVKISLVLEKVQKIVKEVPSKIIPVFINYNNDIRLLDSILNLSTISSSVFYLPQGETWPTEEYLVQANRRIIFFVDGKFENTSRIMHPVADYALQISANEGNNRIEPKNFSQELMIIRNLDHLPVQFPGGQFNRNLVPDYINFLLEKWKNYGKRPNFLFVGAAITNFSFLVDQLNSFTWIKGTVKTDGKKLDMIYWKNPDIMVTGSTFSFPFRGGEEIILTPFSPGYKMTPEQLIITGEMSIPEKYQIIANPLNPKEDLKGSFSFEDGIKNDILPSQTFQGENSPIVQDIKRGNVLRLAENASINLGKPEIYGLRNSSFTVTCFVKFSEILDFGDNAILGNYESGYRRGLHLILRSGHPYFGLWANDYISSEKLNSNEWYHLAWRYIIETGEQAIFLNGKYIGGSEGHPPFSGTGDIHLGSALSSGASLRGYIDNLYIWNRPLSDDEIDRISLDEKIIFANEAPKRENSTFMVLLIILISVFATVATFYFIFRKKKHTESNVPATEKRPEVSKNKIELFGEFRAIDNNGTEISESFTPKVKELFIFIMINTLKSAIGANVSDINETLWFGIPSDKVANNRSVTLNKLRKLLQKFDGVEIISVSSGYLQLKMREPFYCDFASAYKLCQIPEGLSRSQLINFFEIVKRGRFLKGIQWSWCDEIRGYTGNQVIDILLNLASIYQKELNLSGIEKIAQRILDYDDLNEEAIYLQVWALQKTNNINMAKFSFASFTKKYEASFGEPYPMNFQQFNTHFEQLLK